MYPCSIRISLRYESPWPLASRSFRRDSIWSGPRSPSILGRPGSRPLEDQTFRAKKHQETSLVGGWATPLKNMSSSIGMIRIPIYGKIKNGNQTTNQIKKPWVFDSSVLSKYGSSGCDVPEKDPVPQATHPTRFLGGIGPWSRNSSSRGTCTPRHGQLG